MEYWTYILLACLYVAGIVNTSAMLAMLEASMKARPNLPTRLTAILLWPLLAILISFDYAGGFNDD